MRQFDVNFKINIVVEANRIRRSGKRGAIKTLLDTHALSHSHLKYWHRQYLQGHFAPQRAIAFSRKDTMVRL